LKVLKQPRYYNLGCYEIWEELTVKLPSWINYAKIRASYGLVGNHPNIYQANVGYNQESVSYNHSNVIFHLPNNSVFGNDDIVSEKKREAELGIETRFWKNRMGLDLSYYNNKVINQIIIMTTPASSGTGSQLVNGGDLGNEGLEAAIHVEAIKTDQFRWTTNFNFAINRNKLIRLPNGLSYLELSNQDGGYLMIRAKEGETLGNIYTHPRTTDAKGNYLIDTSGFYILNTKDYQYNGNIMPKIIGGFTNSFGYKNFSLDITLDYRFGGKMISIPTYYQIGAGMFENTLQYRDLAHGGIAYDALDEKTAYYQASPTGKYKDGIILNGVTEKGTPNQKVINAALYYMNTYNWESSGLYEYSVFDNSYIKLRELTLSYTLPKSILHQLHFQSLQIALTGRNLCYFLKTIPHGLDPEVGVGSSWLSQGIDGGTAPASRTFGFTIRGRF